MDPSSPSHGNLDNTGVKSGEVVSMITDIQPAEDIITDMVADAAERMGKGI